MKKKVVVISIVILLVLLVGACIFMGRKSISFTTARCIVTDKGSYMFVDDGGPVCMHDITESNMFEGLEMGDKIFVVHDGIAETYPAQTRVYYCIKLEDGSMNDVPQKHVQELTELGWFEKTQLTNTQRVGVVRLPGDAANPEDAGEEINISVDLPESWEFESVDSNEYGGAFGFSIWPKECETAKLVILYYEGFAVCGTGLTVEPGVVADQNVEFGYYDGNTIWEYMVFIDLNREYVVLNQCDAKEWEGYGKEVMAILSTLEFK